MNTKRLVLTIIVVFVVANLTGFLIHAVLLTPDYMAIKEHYRPEGQEKMLFICLAYFAFAIGSVWIYAKGIENEAWVSQGLRFGIVMWLVVAVPWICIAYAVQPVPMTLMVKQILFEGVDKTLLGVITAALYRP